MTSIALLSGDFEILFDDETDGGDGVVGMKMIRRAAGASATVHTTQALYSAIADATDDFQAMGFENPMLPVTPNAFTLENKYFIDRRSTEFLKEGAISADWTLVGAQGVIAVEWSGGTGPIDADRGSKVTQAGTAHTGTMLDFETLPDAKTITWIRPDTSSDTFSGTGALTNTGTLSTTASVAGTNGTQLYSSIQAIGSVPNATEVYLVQERFKMTSSDASFQWWATDPSVSLGIIDILIRVEKDGVSIADGDVEVFARQYTTQYDNFRLRVNAGGRSALPLASSADINNTTGYRTFTGSTYTGTLEIGDGIYLGANFGVATKKGVLTRQTLSSQTVVEYYLIGDLTDFTNTDALKGYDFATGADTTDLVTVASVPGANLLGPTDPAVGEGGTVTLSLGGFLEDRDGDGSTEPYSIQFDCQGPTNPVPIAKVYERLKYITSRGQIADLITGMNVPGETYRGLEAVIEYDTPTGVLTEGDDMTSVTSSTWSARLLHDNTGNSPKYITVTDQQTSVDVPLLANNDVLAGEGGPGVEDVLINTGTIGVTSITSPKSSPFGTFTGSQIFGARGIDFTNTHGDDTQSYILTDDLGTLRNPPNTVTFTVSNTLSGDRVMVGREHATLADEIEKDKYTLTTPATTFNGVDDIQVEIAELTDANDDLPDSGVLRIVDISLQEEHRYYYSARRLEATGEFDLIDITVGSVTSTSTTNLIDTGATFQAEGVEIGMMVKSTESGKRDQIWEVTAVNSETDLSVVQIYGPTGTWDSSATADAYSINKLIGDHTDPTPADYVNTDKMFVPYVDKEAAGASMTSTFVKKLALNFDVVVNVRRSAATRLIPFTQTTTINDAGGSSTTVRTTDTIAT